MSTPSQLDALAALAVLPHFRARSDTEAAFKALLDTIATAREQGRMEHPETVICAALRLPDGHVFRGHRHADCMRTAVEFVTWNGGVDPGEHHWCKVDHCSDQGFITSRNRYVDREEGMRLQLAAGVESASSDGRGYRGKTLFSEDLY